LRRPYGTQDKIDAIATGQLRLLQATMSNTNSKWGVLLVLLNGYKLYKKPAGTIRKPEPVG